MKKNTIVCFFAIVTILLLFIASKSINSNLNRETFIHPTNIASDASKNSNLYLPNSYSQYDFEDSISQTTLYDNYSWLVTVDKEFYRQLFFGKWKIINIVPIEITIPSTYSGFDENNNFHGQDLIDNIVGQEIFFGGDYVENHGVKYELSEGYKTYSVPLLSEDTIIGCTSAKTLGITGGYFSIVFFEIVYKGKGEEGICDFTSLNQLYLKDLNTIYASIDGCLTFELQRYTD